MRITFGWEAVVADQKGADVPVDKSGSALPYVGNQRSGFYLGEDGTENLSFNQYVWCCTANPFNGGQVWRVDNVKEEVTPNIPASVHIAVGEETSKSVRAMVIPDNAPLTLHYDSDLVSLELVKCGAAGTIHDYRSTTEIVKNTALLRRKTATVYKVTEWTETFSSQMYDLVITGKKSGSATVEVTISSVNESVTKRFTVKVDGDAETAAASAYAPGLSGSITQVGAMSKVSVNAQQAAELAIAGTGGAAWHMAGYDHCYTIADSFKRGKSAAAQSQVFAQTEKLKQYTSHFILHIT